MPQELPKAYEPGAIEARWAETWSSRAYFALPTPAEAERVFTLLLPPPNVTGRLHMGHMLNQTEMDIIIRWKRMGGYSTLWLPGTDHAGIATQMMVERQLAAEGKKRMEMGREAFIARVWEWKKLYGGAIFDQMKRLGVTVDWQREYFTMDDHLSRAVREAFVRLHEKGKIYRGKYIVNWCPRCRTAISDLEVVHEETAGKLYHLRYPLTDGTVSIVIATTRPETMLGDTAVAVNPKDPRYQGMIGKTVTLPLINREVPIIADDWANPEFGTGAVKVTPAHDPNDFAIGQRHNLPAIAIMDEDARIIAGMGEYGGLDRFKARAKVLEDLEAQGLVDAVKDHTFAVGKCDRCKTVVEPRLSTQWFVKVEGDIAARAIEAVKRGHIQITPENYKTIYLNWMGNIHDWCISRQLWWGHRIPAWHCADCKEATVAREAPAKCAHCGSAALEQDTDVLDTWFSSGLLPFTVFGWPEKTPELNVFYPTTLLITGFDILFFWVARMIMMGCWFMGGEDQLDLATPAGDALLKKSVPFESVYIHALVRDAERQKMSKTKGNVVDPIEIIEHYGTDAVRFTLASLAAPGTDISFNPERVEGYRAFANKIWNAARFLFMNVEKARETGAWGSEPFTTANVVRPSRLEDRWILSRFNAAAAQVNAALGEYRFHEAAHVIYHFFWGEFCDWYVEMVKLRLNAGEDEAAKAATREALRFSLNIFEQSLRLLSPLMPFITEEIWHALYEGGAPHASIALADYPQGGGKADSAAEEDMRQLQKLITEIREQRALRAVPLKEKVPIKLNVPPFEYTLERIRDGIFEHHLKESNRWPDLFSANAGIIKKLANIEEIEMTANSQKQDMTVSKSSDQFTVAIVYEAKIDAAAERERLQKELKKMEAEMANAQRNLANQQFLAKAPAAVVDGIKRRSAELEELLRKTESALQQLK